MIIRSRSLVLRDAQEKDVLALASYQSDPRYLEFYSEIPSAESIVRQAKAWASKSPRSDFQLIIELKVSSEVIGCIGLRQEGYEFGTAEIGVELAPDYWGFGYAQEAVAEILSFGAAKLELARCLSITSPSNIRAHKLLEHFGFRQAGRQGDQLVFEASIDS